MEKRHNRKNLSCENEYERVCVRMEHGFETRGGEGMCVDLFLFILWEENNPPSHQIGEPFFGIHTSLPPPPLKAHTPPKRNVPSGLVCAYRVGITLVCVCHKTWGTHTKPNLSKIKTVNTPLPASLEDLPRNGKITHTPTTTSIFLVATLCG